MQNDFTHLHVHTEYSLLDGACRIKDLIRQTKELGMNSLAITDHGVMYGVVDFYREAVKEGIKPIIGCEVYTARRRMQDKQTGMDSDQGHLILLAKDEIGYKNLMKIVSTGFLQGFYYKPRIDIEYLKMHSKGLIALSACLAGDIPSLILRGDYNSAAQKATELNEIFGYGNFFLELQHNGIPEQSEANQGLLRISKEMGIPLVATNDVHYLRRQDSAPHDVLLCIQTGARINDENRMRFSSNELFLKSPDEMSKAFINLPSALENTSLIASRCDVRMDFSKHYLPSFNLNGEALEDGPGYLKKLCISGLEKRNLLLPEYLERLEYELDIISKMNYSDYFLIVWDFISFARSKGIMVGPGRGSAAGSLVSYSLFITNIDPIKYVLLFERFLNPERISMPDIDIDFCYERRQEVIDYVNEKYGRDKVAQIITFGTMAARGAIRDVGRALDLPYNEVDAIAKMIPFQLSMTIEKALELNESLKNKYETEEKVRELINTARLLEGMPRHASTHAAGVVISREPLWEYVPLQKNDDIITTQFPMGTLEAIGLLKIDFLGLRTLTVIRDAIALVAQNEKKHIEIDNLQFNDPVVFKMIGEGRTSGVFQLESSGMTQFMKELKPESIEDIIAGISLYRPGPMNEIPKYIYNKNHPQSITYDHPLLEKILKVTYGCFVYQEQVMQVFRELAGYTMSRADLVRKAISKKIGGVLDQERLYFIKGKFDPAANTNIPGCVANGVGTTIANIIFDKIIDFANYAFNKSHAAAYAVIAYQTAYLKYYHPLEFMAALLNSFLGSSDKTSQYVYDCRIMGISVLPPDINESAARFSASNGKIRFGLEAVKNVGGGVVNEIIQGRSTNGPFKNFIDFCTRMEDSGVNKRCLESLIKSGAFDTMGVFRSKLLASYDKILEGLSAAKKSKLEGQLSLFEIGASTDHNGLPTDDIFPVVKDTYPSLKEFDSIMILAMEKEMLGLYISGHPLDEYKEQIGKNVNFYSKYLLRQATEEHTEFDNFNGIAAQENAFHDDMKVTIAGIITSKKTKTTKTNNLMAFITIEDLFGVIEVIVFPTVYSKYSDMINEDNIVQISGRLNLREDEDPKIICEEIKPMVKVIKPDKPDKPDKQELLIRFDKNTDFMIKEAVYAILTFFSGNITATVMDPDMPEAKTTRHFKVSGDKYLMDELKQKLPEGNVNIC